jgi:hypothetical protein
MPTIEAKKVTESLAHRYSAAEALSEAAQAPPQDGAKDGASPANPAKLASAAPPADGAAGKAGAEGDDAPKPPIKIHMTVKRPAHHKPLIAHAKPDTPTLAAAKAVAPPSAGRPVQPPQQTAGAAKPVTPPSPTSSVAPPKSALPVAGAATSS